MFVHFKPVEYDDLREQFVKDKAAGLDVSHYGHTPVVPRDADSSVGSSISASEAEAKLNMHKASYSKDKGGHEHDQHDEETLKRHMDNIDKEREEHSTAEEAIEIKKQFLKDKEKAPLGGNNVENPDGRTALHEAASNGEYEEVVRLLGNQDTDMLNARDENGWQAIHEATRSGSLEIVK